MKKVISILSALLILLSLSACGGKSMKPTYTGTWELDHVAVSGIAFTHSELQAIGQDVQASLVLKDDGKAFMTLGSEQRFFKWSETKNGVQIGDTTFTMEDGLLLYGGNDSTTLYFKKVSESQLIEKQATEETQMAETTLPETTAPATEATTVPATEPTTVPTTEAAENLIDGMRPEFKEAMDAYEAFYKEYCELLKKYTENPTDFSILGKYANMLAKIDEVDKAFQKWDESDLNSEELKYYLDVNNRVLKMLVDVTGNS